MGTTKSPNAGTLKASQLSAHQPAQHGLPREEANKHTAAVTEGASNCSQTINRKKRRRHTEAVDAVAAVAVGSADCKRQRIVAAALSLSTPPRLSGVHEHLQKKAKKHRQHDHQQTAVAAVAEPRLPAHLRSPPAPSLPGGNSNQRSQPTFKQSECSQELGGLKHAARTAASLDSAEHAAGKQGHQRKKQRHMLTSPASTSAAECSAAAGVAGEPARDGAPAVASWPFETDYNDHFETSRQAIADLEPILFRLAQLLGKSKEQLVVYDPYFCTGSVAAHFKTSGIANFINHNRDFYADIASSSIPAYDILVTNPPYSADHKERIVQFCAASGKPWALLMPNYVANKAWFSDAVSFKASAAAGGSMAGAVRSPATTSHVKSSSQHSIPPPPPFYLVPFDKYSYEHPAGTGHSDSPFFSIWFVQLGQHTESVYSWMSVRQGRQLQQYQALQRNQQAVQGGGGAELSAGARGSAHAHSESRSKGCSAPKVRVQRSVSELRDSKAVPTQKRMNPKQRAKLKKQRAAAG